MFKWFWTIFSLGAPMNIYLSETYSTQINLLASVFGFPLLQTFYELSEFKY